MIDLHSDERYMREAYKQAQIAYEEKEIPVGAVVVCKKKIIARAYNQVEKLGDVTAHAEMLAITSAQNFLGSKYLNECTLYVTLEPCGMCSGAGYWSQIGKIVFGAADDHRGYRNLSPMLVHPKTDIVYGVMAAECKDLLTDFFAEMRNKNN